MAAAANADAIAAIDPFAIDVGASVDVDLVVDHVVLAASGQWCSSSKFPSRPLSFWLKILTEALSFWH